MKRNGLISLALASLAVASGVGCDESDSQAEERGKAAIELCRGHGGVAALDDDIVICRDQSVHEGEV